MISFKLSYYQDDKLHPRQIKKRHSRDRAPGADPARAWLGAILGVLADPADEFELCGVLREVFGKHQEVLVI